MSELVLSERRTLSWLAALAVQDQWVTINFHATVHPDLPWSLRPQDATGAAPSGSGVRRAVSCRQLLVEYHHGQAIPGFVPWQAASFVHTLECFCFRQQTLQGWDSTEVPLRFVICPDLPAEIGLISLCYSVMRVPGAQRGAVP
ncbi:MAG: cytochrome c oxidase assembly protein [Chromatiaceae bacterium]|jgi:cytochrome c oxidase assembly protein subunit 11